MDNAPIISSDYDRVLKARFHGTPIVTSQIIQRLKIDNEILISTIRSIRSKANEVAPQAYILSCSASRLGRHLDPPVCRLTNRAGNRAPIDQD